MVLELLAIHVLAELLHLGEDDAVLALLIGLYLEAPLLLLPHLLVEDRLGQLLLLLLSLLLVKELVIVGQLPVLVYLCPLVVVAELALEARVLHP